MPEHARNEAPRPPLTERRKADTRREITKEAVRLFVRRGAENVSAEEIARAAGVSTRTFWRYFATKEQAVAPLLATALDQTLAHFRDRPATEPLLEALGRASVHNSTTWPGTSAMLTLVRQAKDNAELRSVWLQVHHGVERRLAEAIAERRGEAPEDLRGRLHAGMAVLALRTAVEEYAWQDEKGSRRGAEVLDQALAIVAEGFGAGTGTSGNSAP
ncbi:TetR family transcriptional regulator [Streptomyces sp. NPDC001255]|uniref:TetR family transcriptional regulator n=1 Tax=Streptomyces sp. NPDC001255 TaxID=3364550 RepID=UPI0036BABDA3